MRNGEHSLHEHRRHHCPAIASLGCDHFHLLRVVEENAKDNIFSERWAIRLFMRGITRPVTGYESR